MGCTTEMKEYPSFLFVTSEPISMCDPMEINTASPFKDLFPVKPGELERIEKSMETKGYDSAHPIIVWKGHNSTVIDGHTRLAASKKLMFNLIPVILKEFKDETEALEYAINSQVNRRNLTDAELIKCMSALDQRKTKGGNKYLKASREALGKTAQKTADLLGISRAKVERIRAVCDHASDDIKAAVSDGKMSINKAYNKTMETRKQANQEEQNSHTESQLQSMKANRILVLRSKVSKFAQKLIEDEIRIYPEIIYSEQDKKELSNVLSSELATIINNNIIPASPPGN